MQHADARMGDVECRVTWLDVKATSRNEALSEMVDHLVRVGFVDAGNAQTILRQMVMRVDLGLGAACGFANPHIRTTCVDRPILALGCSRLGVDFGALDRRPVYLVGLQLLPAENPDPDYRAALYRLVSSNIVRRLICEANNVDEAIDLLRDLAICLDTPCTPSLQPHTSRWASLLTSPELDLLRLLAQGFQSQDAAEKLGLSLEEVNARKAAIMAKLEENDAGGATGGPSARTS